MKRKNKPNREISLYNLRFAAFYHQLMGNMKYSKKRLIKDRMEVLRCLSIILKTIAEKYINNEGGVFISNFGYLCHIMKPERKIFINGLTKEVARKSTGGYMYRHLCLDFMPVNQFFHFYFGKAIKCKIAKFMNKGYTYKFLYDIVASEKRYIGKRRIKQMKWRDEDK